MRTLLDRILYPVIWMLSHPACRPLTRALFRLSTKAQGINNAYLHPIGVTVDEWKFLQRLAHLLPENPIVLDVGFHTGSYTNAVLHWRPNATVFAFEPNPTLAVRQENLPNQVQLVVKAASDTTGTATFHDAATAPGASVGSLHAEQVQVWNHGETKSWEVETIRLDDFVETENIEQLHLLKIDTEGHDISVLRGAEQLLKTGRIDVIQFEFLGVNATLKNTFQDFFRLLSDHYLLFRLTLSGRLLPIRTYQPFWHEIFGSQNLIAIRKEGPLANHFRDG